MKQDDYRITDHLPASLNHENLREVSETVDEALKCLFAKVINVSIYPRIDELPSELIDILAVQLHVDFYDTTLSRETRRALVKNSMRWHLKKGTRRIVNEVLSTIFDNCTVSEWFEYGGEPYHFKFKLNLDTDETITPQKLNDIIRLVESVKNVRSVLEEMHFERHAPATIYYAAPTSTHKRLEVMPQQMQNAQTAVTVHIGVATSTHKSFTAYPKAATGAAVTGRRFIGAAPYLYRSYEATERRNGNG